eukprot:282150_1
MFSMHITTASLSENLFPKKSTDSTPIAMDYHHEPFDCYPFTWINKWIVYFPMFTSTTMTNHKVVKRSKAMHHIVFPCIIIMCTSLRIWDTYYHVFHTVSDTKWFYASTLCDVLCCVCGSLVIFCRWISLYYFFYHFQFYTSSNNHHDIEMKSLSNASRCYLNMSRHHTFVKQTSTRIKISLFWILLSSLIISICRVITLVNTSDRSWYFIIESVHDFVYIYFTRFPIFLSQFVLSILYCEQSIFLNELCEVIDKSIINIDFAAAIHDYASFRNQFEERSNLLELMMKFRMAAMIGFVWINTTFLFMSETWIDALPRCLLLIHDAWPFFEMVMAGNAVTVQFDKFRKNLYLIGTRRDFSINLSFNNQTQYLFLLEYVTNFPLEVNIFGQQASFKNAFKVIAAFVAAKCISYLFKEQMTLYVQI